jgi:hypothetical protein
MTHAPEVLVTDRAVYFDGQELPWYIAKDGVSFKPGGSDDINRLTVEFLVSTTTFAEDLKWEMDHGRRWARLERVVAFKYNLLLLRVDQTIKEYM